MEFACLFLRCHFAGKALVASRNVSCLVRLHILMHIILRGIFVSLKFIRLLQVVFFSQQRLNRPAINAVHLCHSLPENQVVILIGCLSKHLHNYV